MTSSVFYTLACFKIVSDEIEWLRLKFGHMLLAGEFLVYVVKNLSKRCSPTGFIIVFV